MAKEKSGSAFDGLEDLTKPRDTAWDNWAEFKNVGDKVEGYIRDVFFRPAEGVFKDQRALTLEQADGKLINVGMKTLPFILNKTDDLHLGDPVRVTLSELKPNKGLSDTKIFSFAGKQLPENAENKTVRELYEEDKARGGTATPKEEANDVPFE